MIQLWYVSIKFIEFLKVFAFLTFYIVYTILNIILNINSNINLKEFEHYYIWQISDFEFN
jgi:hypothetical protein